MVNTVGIAFVTAALTATSSLAAPARGGGRGPSRPHGSRTDQIGNVIAGAGVIANVAGTVVGATQPKREILEAREPRRGGGRAPSRPHGSKTDKFGNVIAGAGVIADVAGTIVGATQPKREFLEAREPRRGGGRAPSRPQGSRTDQIGNVIAGAGVVSDIAKTVVGATQPKREFLEAREPRRGGGRAPSRPHGSKTDKFGNVIAGAGVIADVAGTIVGATQPKREFLEAREPRRGGGRAPSRPHGSKTDKFGNVIAGAGVVADVAGTIVGATQPKREFLEAREPRRGGGRAPSRPQGSRTDQIGNVIAGAGVVSDIAKTVVGATQPKREFLEAREPRRGGGRAPSRPHGSKTDKFGNVIAGAGVIADVAGTIVGATQPKREFLEAREPRRGGGRAPSRPHGSKTDKFGNVIAGAGVISDIASTIVGANQPKREFIEDLIEREFSNWEMEQLD